MCGIAGYALSNPAAAATARNAVTRMTARMRRRGPDAEGLWQTDGIVLGHRRLAILDLDQRANQPFTSVDGRYSVVFNGEIYNFVELRKELSRQGAVFRTNSDTEVLLTMFASHGERMLARLRGMFAFGIWDSDAKELFLARDPYGIKPLYYTSTRDGVLFASQVKALTASGATSNETEIAAVAGFYLWGSVPEPWTTVKDVSSVPPGHFVRVRNGVVTPPACWHDIAEQWHREPVASSERDLRRRVREEVTDSLRAHLVADVPICIFLSGGIDSATLAGLAHGLGSRLEGVTLQFREFAGRCHDETPAAAQVAAHYQLPHTIRQVTGAEFEQDLPTIVDAMDQPSIDGINTWYASKAAAELGYKVVLSGLGGDELFCGYSLFAEVPRAAAIGKLLTRLPGARAFLEPASVRLAKWCRQPKLAGVPKTIDSMAGIYFLRRGLFLPEELGEFVGPRAAQHALWRLGGAIRIPPGIDDLGGAAAIGLLESTLYLRNQLLRDSDWTSMAHSLELRTPLVDVCLLQALAPYVSSFKKGVGKHALAAAPALPLPRNVATRQKTGFGIPMETWCERTSCIQTARLNREFSRGEHWSRRWARTLASEFFPDLASESPRNTDVVLTAIS